MTPASEAANDEHEVVALAAAHLPRSIAELEEWLRGFLKRAGIEAGFALFQVGSHARRWILEAGGLDGLGCVPGMAWDVDHELLLGAVTGQCARWKLEGDRTTVVQPLHHRATIVGWLVLSGYVPEDLRPVFDVLADHVAIAFTNLKLFEEVARSADVVHGSLVAYQELDHLLRAGDIDRVLSGVLQTCLHTLGSNHGAAYLAGDDGRLVRHAGWGIPDGLFEALLTTDGQRWLDAVFQTGAAVLRADPVTGRIPELDPQSVRPGIKSIAAAPLRHEHGTCGVVVALNAPESDQFPQQLETFRGVCSLGAAIVLNRQLHDQALRAQRNEEQLRLARAIQERLRPQGLPVNPRIETAWRTAPADDVACDYLDLFSGPDGTVHAVLADVSGHGVGSALLMCSFRADFRARVEGTSIARVMDRVNDTVCSEVGDSGMFITALYARLPADGSRCEVVNAGHDHGILLRGADQRIERIEATGPPLGVIKQAAHVAQTFVLSPGDVLVIPSDGITGAASASGDRFGATRLQDLVRSLAARPAAEIAREVFRALHGFLGRETTADDASVIVVKLRQ